MTKVATYDDLLAEIEAQQAYIAQLEQEREANQATIAHLVKVADENEAKAEYNALLWDQANQEREALQKELAEVRAEPRWEYQFMPGVTPADLPKGGIPWPRRKPTEEGRVPLMEGWGMLTPSPAHMPIEWRPTKEAIEELYAVRPGCLYAKMATMRVFWKEKEADFISLREAYYAAQLLRAQTKKTQPLTAHSA